MFCAATEFCVEYAKGNQLLQLGHGLVGLLLEVAFYFELPAELLIGLGEALLVLPLALLIVHGRGRPLDGSFEGNAGKLVEEAFFVAARHRPSPYNVRPSPSAG